MDDLIYLYNFFANYDDDDDEDDSSSEEEDDSSNEKEVSKEKDFGKIYNI